MMLAGSMQPNHLLGTMQHMERRSTITTTEARWTCQHCHKVYVRENAYMSHECKQMKRLKELQDPIGQVAYNHYTTWMRAMKRMPPTATAFMASRFFRTFVEFSKWAKQVNLPKPESFIKLMVNTNHTPTMWRMSEAYDLYLLHLDRAVAPLEQAAMSIETLLTAADAHDVDVSEVFSALKASDIVQMLVTRRLSPWLLVFSRKYLDMYNTRTSIEERIQLDNLVRPSYLKSKIEDHTDDVAGIRKLIKELGI